MRFAGWQLTPCDHIMACEFPVVRHKFLLTAIHCLLYLLHSLGWYPSVYTADTLLLLLKCTYLSDTVTQNALGALYTVNKVPAYNIGGESELATSGPENSSEKEMFSVLVGRW